MRTLTYLLLMSLTLLSGCSLLGTPKADPSDVYVLNRLPDVKVEKSSHAATLLVLPPETTPLFNTTQMAYTMKPYQISYFGINKWAETPSQMLQPLIVQSLINTHHFHAVVSPPYLGRYQYILATQIIELQQNFINRPVLVEFTIRAQLIRVATNQIVATKEFRSAIPIRQNTPYSGVISANRATAIILGQLTEFTISHT